MNRVFMHNTMIMPARGSNLRHSSLRAYWNLLALSGVLMLFVVVVPIITVVAILRSTP
ncbi:MAG: hypothetical protein LAP21_25150 [Acidobacteriia bacterium]|nr:hypothetical protein [Terriglobia bacterium]